MKNKKPLPTAADIQQQSPNDIADTITNKILDYNLLLYKLESEENFEQCSVVQLALEIYLVNAAQQLALLTNHSSSIILDELRWNSQYIMQSIKEEQPNPDSFEINVEDL